MLCPTLRALPLVFLVALVSACGDDTPTSPTPTPTPITENFSGTLNPNGGATHVFYGVALGAMTSTLTSIGPDSTTRVGLSIGSWNGSACNWIVANDAATTATVVTGNITAIGASLCTRIYDVGTLTGAVTYEITVIHP